VAATKITVNHNGSLRIEGDFEIVDPNGQPFGLAGRTTIGLCRCGQSSNKPFATGATRLRIRRYGGRARIACAQAELQMPRRRQQ